jgi:hypothetical protein
MHSQEALSLFFRSDVLGAATEMPASTETAIYLAAFAPLVSATYSLDHRLRAMKLKSRCIVCTHVHKSLLDV